MLILGVNDGHNASACLYEDGAVVAAVQEERLRRVKNWDGTPALAINWILRHRGITAGDIDLVAMSGEHKPRAQTKEERMSEYRHNGSLTSNGRRLLRRTPLKRLSTVLRQNSRIREMGDLAFDKQKVKFVNHHLCHAAAAYYGYGNFREPVLVLTNDGMGDGVCATVNIGESGKLNGISAVTEYESIANLYAVVTFMMGMVPLEHEYKLMGMAPYADSQGGERIYKVLRELFEFEKDNPLKWRRANGMPETFFSYSYLRRLFELERFDGIMGGLQKFTEAMLTQWVTNCVQKTGIAKIALSGGIFMNVKANKSIMELPEVDQLFVYPSCGDETNAMGACYHVYASEMGIEKMKPLETLYLGPSYSDAEVVRAIEDYKFKSCDVSFKPCANIEAEIARLLAEGKVVARFADREEFGARSLGNRAILADPSRVNLIRVINDMIKNRDFWMPFACSIREERADYYIKNPKRIAAPYMILSFDTTEKVAEISAGIHPYDQTVRPQVVSKADNRRYHKVISLFEELTGIGAVLNTSFNLHGYPIVSSPTNALEVLDNSGLEVLAIENYLVWKKTCVA